MDELELQDKVSEVAERLEVPGVAVGVYHHGVELYAFHGVTSVANPLPVDADTLFQFGSTGKTFTATAIMRLVDQGLVSLDAPVRTYVPELKLKDESVARAVTVLHLLNHTAGWAGDLMTNTGDGDDAIAKLVALMADIEQDSPLGAGVSYNNASLSLAGRIIEKVTGQTYEQAIKELLFEPLGLDHSFFFPNEIMTMRFAVGHTQKADGSAAVASPWALPRGGWPAGGISSNAADLVTWARFHLGDGTAADGTRVLGKDSLDLMKQPTVAMPGSALGDFVGISWMLRDVDGVRLVGHGGDTVGQHSEFVMVPEHDFAVITLTNATSGSQFNEEMVRWALAAGCGVVERDPEPVLLGDDALAEYTGRYETIAVICHITAGSGGLLLRTELKPHVVEELAALGEEAGDQPPFPLGLLAGPGDRYVVTEGPGKGMKGYFARDEAGRLTSVHVGGRLATRVE